MAVEVFHGDSRDVLKTLADCSVDSVVTDPPYALVSIVKRFGKPGSAPAKGDVYRRASAGFMSQQWDTGDTAFDPEFWVEVLRVLKPGGHVVAFGGTRTYHRLACAIEDAGFEVRDMISWIFGSGFPKSHNVSKGIDKAAGAERMEAAGGNTQCQYLQRGEPCAGHPDRRGTAFGLTVHAQPTAPATAAARQWEGWGTALKPALEPICLARKPLVGTVAANVQAHGAGALNIDGCRVGTETITSHSPPQYRSGRKGEGGKTNDGRDAANWERYLATKAPQEHQGRWPANVVHDGSDEVVSAFPDAHVNSPGQQSGRAGYDGGWGPRVPFGYDTSGSAARFFYSAKADTGDRLGSKHPTVKPVDLMRWLVRLITPPGGTVLDPFAGSGTTGMACLAEGIDCILVEREAEYVADIRRRIAHVHGDDTPLFARAAE